MKTDDAMVQVLTQINERLSSIERRQDNDKREVLDRISSFESSSNTQFRSISESLTYERTRVDEIHKDRKKVSVNFSRKMMGMNTAFAGIIAFIVSVFTK